MTNKKLLIDVLKNLNDPKNKVKKTADVQVTPQMKKGGSKFSSDLNATNRLFKKNSLFKKSALNKPNSLFKKKKIKSKTYSPTAPGSSFPMFFDNGGEKDKDQGKGFKKRLMKRYPGMQDVYGPEGENLNIVKDPNYDARSVGYGDIEFSFPGDSYLRYDNIIPKDDPNYIDVEEYIYSNIAPDKYNSVYNPRGANRRDVFLDMMHGMRDDPNFQPLLQNFEKAVKNTRGEDMDWQYEGEVQSGSTQSKERFDENYVDGQLRAELAPKTIGRFAKGRKDYRMERKYDSPEMKEAAQEILNYLKTPKENYIETELTPEEIEEYRKGGYIVEDISIPSLNQMEKGGAACPPGYIKVRGKCVKPQNMIMRNQMAPYVTNDINDPRLEAYKDSLGLHNQSLANHAEVRRNNMIPVFTNLPPNGSRRLYDRVLRNQTIKPEGYIHGERTSRTNPSVREVVYPVYKAPVQQVVYKPKSKKKTTKPVDKKPVIVEPVIQEEKQIETIPTLQPTYVEHPLNKFIETNNPGPGTDVMPQYAIDELPMYATPDGGAEWVGDTKRYIDWDGNSVGYNLPRVRKPGHGGDLIRKGKRRYLHLPSIESRYEAEIVPEEYARGGETDCPPGYAKDEFGDCIRVKTEKDVQLKPLWEKDRDKYGKDYISWYEAWNPKKWGLNDYSEYSSFNSAFRNARESGEDEFVYKGERYNTKQVPKKESDMYWKSKKFVEDYYKTQPYAKMDNDEKFMYNDEFIKKKYGTTWSELYNKQQDMDYNDPEYNKISKLMNQIFEEEQAITQNNHPEFDTYYKKNYVNKEKQERLGSLNKPTYFSITSQKPQDMSEDGYWDPQKNKMFLYTKADPGKFNSTYVHEVSHKADNFVDVLNSVPPINLKAFNDGPWSESFNQETYDYVSDPSEIEARKLSTLFYLSEHKTPWEAGKITQKTLDNLYRLADEDKLPYDIVQLLDLYGAQQDDLLKYLNGDYNYNYKPKNKEGGQHNVGDEVELTDAEVKRLRSLGYIIEQL